MGTPAPLWRTSDLVVTKPSAPHLDDGPVQQHEALDAPHHVVHRLKHLCVGKVEGLGARNRVATRFVGEKGMKMGTDSVFT